MYQVYRPFLITFLIGLLVAVGNHFNLLRPLTNSFSLITEPAMAAETTAARRGVNLFTLFVSIRDLQRENTELRKKNAELEAKISEYKEVSHENDVLRHELNFVQEQGPGYIPAQLIGRTATGIIKDLVINRGENDGIKSGQPVLSQGYLVGVVSDVSAGQSTVRLLTNPRSIIPVVGQDSRATGILRGGISGLTMTDILIDATTKAEEPIVTSGLGGELPAGIPVGTIIEVQERKGDITKKASVRSPLDLSKLEMVFIRK